MGCCSTKNKPRVVEPSSPIVVKDEEGNSRVISGHNLSQVISQIQQERPEERFELSYLDPEGGQVPITTQEEFDKVMSNSKNKLSLLVRSVGAPLSYLQKKIYKKRLETEEYLQEYPEEYLEETSLQQEESIDRNFDVFDDYVCRVFDGFLKVFNVRSLKFSRYNHPLYDRSSRVVVLSNTDLIITGGSKKPYSAMQVTLATGKVTHLHSMPTPRAEHASVVLDDKVYVFGGRENAPLAACEVFKDGNWQLLPALNYARFGHSATTMGHRIYVVGGTREDTIEMLESDCWELLQVKLYSGLSGCGVVSVSQEDILVFGGSSSLCSERVWKVNVSENTIENKGELPKYDSFNSQGYKTGGKFLFMGASSCFSLDLNTFRWKLLCNN